MTPPHEVSLSHQHASHHKKLASLSDEQVLKDNTTAELMLPQNESDVEDEVLIVEVQLGANVKTQLQIGKSQNIDYVSKEFCKQHGKNDCIW